jgi:multiple sugar transport system permease protein
MRYGLKGLVTRILVAAFVIIIIFINLLPVYWLFATSLRVEAEQFTIPPKWIFNPTIEHYKNVLGPGSYYFLYFKNSVIVAIGSTLLALALGIPSAYSIARLNLKRKKDLAFYILTLRFAAPIGVIIPLFVTFRELGLLDTYPALIIVHTLMNLPLVTWMLKGFFEELPKELEESAKLDGCTDLGAMVRIALPCSRVGIIATLILSVIFSWNEFFYATCLTGSKTMTLPVALFGYISVHNVNWGSLCASGVITALPVITFAMVVQRYIIRGLTFGAVKG